LTLAEHTQRVIFGADLIASSVEELVVASGVRTPQGFRRYAEAEKMHELLRERVILSTDVDALSLVDASGRIVNSSRVWPPPKVDLSDRDFFTSLRDNTGTADVISETVKNKITGQQSFVLARRVSGADGSFCGVVVATLATSRFEKLFAAVLEEQDAGASVALYRRDGALLVGQPESVESMASSAEVRGFFRDTLARTEQGGLRTRTLDVPQLMALHTVRGHPLFINATNSVAAVLADWQRFVRLILAFAAATITLVVLLWFAFVQQRRMQASAVESAEQLARETTERQAATKHLQEMKLAQDALVQSEQKFSAAFRDSPLPLAVTRQRDSVLVDVNEAWLLLLARKREEVLGRTALEFGYYADPLDRKRLYEALQGRQQLEGFEVWVLRGDGGRLLSRHSMNATTFGQEKCLIWSVVDITHQRAVEAEVRELNVSLERRVQERTKELEQALATLNVAKDELVHSEKLAALGSLVAGVAHEINTPVGIGVTAASYLEDRVKELAVRYESGAISRSDLTGFLATASEATAMVLSNLKRAADLIRSFKMVAVDQASSKRREFMLKETVEEVVSTLRHLVKIAGVRIELDLAEGIRMDSYPGPLGQVLTNLFNNVLIHAFEGREAGCIRIETCAHDADVVLLRFIDDGAGIAPSDIGKIFDPFFTTKFGSGGSGLGLNIVHNIVTSMLGGRISVESELGRGTTFTLTLPLVSPFTESRETA
jgi:PAS domain S-box-containing protein